MRMSRTQIVIRLVLTAALLYFAIQARNQATMGPSRPQTPAGTA